MHHGNGCAGWRGGVLAAAVGILLGASACSSAPAAPSAEPSSWTLAPLAGVVEVHEDQQGETLHVPPGTRLQVVLATATWQPARSQGHMFATFATDFPSSDQTRVTFRVLHPGTGNLVSTRRTPQCPDSASCPNGPEDWVVHIVAP